MNTPVVESSPAKKRVLVWDPLVRTLHWLMALGCLCNLSILSDAGDVHDWVGYVVLGGVIARLVWGFAGSQHARFSDFVPGPSQLLSYCRSLLRRQEPRYIGHNPAGAMMIVALICVVLICGITGWMMGLDQFWGETWVENIHEGSANLILALSVLHVGGATVESIRHRENLILSMVTGRKRAPAGSDVYHRPSRD